MNEDKLDKLVAAVIWLHTRARILNRDFEKKHFGEYGGKLRIMDFSTAIPLDNSERPNLQEYQGECMWLGII